MFNPLAQLLVKSQISQEKLSASSAEVVSVSLSISFASTTLVALSAARSLDSASDIIDDVPTTLAVVEAVARSQAAFRLLSCLRQYAGLRRCGGECCCAGPGA